jgi:hypothetical protein
VPHPQLVNLSSTRLPTRHCTLCPVPDTSPLECPGAFNALLRTFSIGLDRERRHPSAWGVMPLLVVIGVPRPAGEPVAGAG